jgi:hypothetical protein
MIPGNKHLGQEQMSLIFALVFQRLKKLELFQCEKYYHIFQVNDNQCITVYLGYAPGPGESVANWLACLPLIEKPPLLAGSSGA